MWAQQDLRRVLGVAGARVVAGDCPWRRHRTSSTLRATPSPLVAERLRLHLRAVCNEAAPLTIAA